MEKQKNKINKKIALTISVILILIVSIIAIITAVSSIKVSNLAFLEYRIFIMDSDAHLNIAKRGDLIIAKKITYGNVQAGDAVVYKDSKVYYCNDVVNTVKLNTVTKLITAEENGVKYQFSENDVSGKVVKVIPELGKIISFLRTPIGIIFFIVFYIIFFLALRLLWIGKKYKIEEVNSDNNKNI